VQKKAEYENVMIIDDLPKSQNSLKVLVGMIELKYIFAKKLNKSQNWHKT
jgi:hypothetical protein